MYELFDRIFSAAAAVACGSELEGGLFLQSNTACSSKMLAVWALLLIAVGVYSMPYYAPLQGEAGGKRTLVLLDNLVSSKFRHLYEFMELTPAPTLFLRIIFHLTRCSSLTCRLEATRSRFIKPSRPTWR